VRVKKGAVAAKRQINALVTASHIVVTFGYSITLLILQFNAASVIKQDRIYTAGYFFGGIVDIFLSLILWYILDENKSKAILVE
jgi:succinate-acetate transporter protein